MELAMIRRLSLSVLLIASLAGCASMARIEPLAGDGQQVRYQRGQGYVVSVAPSSVVIAEPRDAEYPVTRRVAFVVRIENYGEATIEVGEHSIGASADGVPAAVIPANQLAAEARRAAAWAAAAVAVAGAANQYNASQAGTTTYSGTSSAYAYGSGGSAQAYGSFRGTVTDDGARHAAQAQASRETAAQMAAVEARREAELATIRDSVLQRTTLAPGESTQGVVVVEVSRPPKGAPEYALELRIGADTHRFRFRELREG
jgi:hypothetical protein